MTDRVPPAVRSPDETTSPRDHPVPTAESCGRDERRDGDRFLDGVGFDDAVAVDGVAVDGSGPGESLHFTMFNGDRDGVVRQPEWQALSHVRQRVNRGVIGVYMLLCVRGHGLPGGTSGQWGGSLVDEHHVLHEGL